MPLRPHRSRVWLAIAGLAVYFIAFEAAEMPSLTQAMGKSFRRVDLLLHYLLLPEELVAIWFGEPAEFSLADRLPVLLLTMGILAWAIALGWLLLKLCRVQRFLTVVETWVFAAGVGLNAVSTYVLAIGLLGWLERAACVAPAAVTFAAAFWVWNREKTRKALPRAVSQNGRWLPALLCAVPFAAILLLGAMLPPIDFDVREYHLQAPKEFFLQGTIGFLPHNVYANMPLGTEMHALLGMVLAGDWWLGALVGKTVLASYTALTALGLWAAGRRVVCPTAAAVAALAYLSVPWVIQVSTLGLVDAALGCYLFLTFYAVCLATGNVNQQTAGIAGAVAGAKTGLRNPSATRLPLPKDRGSLARDPACEKTSTADRPIERGQEALFLLAGYLAGGAAGCKYPGVLYVVVPLAIWIPIRLRGEVRRGWSTVGKPAAVFLLAAAVGCGPWFVKNWALTGNPTYPLLYSVFGGKTWTPEKDRQWNAVHRPHDFSPATLGKDLGRVALTSEWLSPLVAPLTALGLLAASRRRLAWGLGAYLAFLFTCWWLLTHRIDRFWIPALPLAAMLAGLGAAWSRERMWRIALLVFLIAGSVANFLAAASVGGGYNAYFVSLARLRNDPRRVDAWHRYFNRHAKQGRVLLVGDAQPFDLEMPVLYNTCFDDSIFEHLAKGRSPAEVRAALTAQGITHVYVHWGEIARYRRTYGFTDFVQPAVFENLVASGVLIPLPEIQDHSGRGYQVAAAP